MLIRGIAMTYMYLDICIMLYEMYIRYCIVIHIGASRTCIDMSTLFKKNRKKENLYI